jgi:nitrate reductase NapE component
MSFEPFGNESPEDILLGSFLACCLMVVLSGVAAVGVHGLTYWFCAASGNTTARICR